MMDNLLQKMEDGFDDFFKEYEKKTSEEVIREMKEAGFQFAEEENRVKEALPCPFCGSVKIHTIDPDEFIPAYRLVCEDCGAGSDYYYTKEEALVAWNRRIIEGFIVDEIGGTHDEGLGWNPNGVFCGECSNTTCVDCPMKDERS